MLIAIDISRAVNEKAGIGQYTYALIKALLKTDQKNHYLLFCTYFRRSKEKEKLLKSFSAPNVKIKFMRIPGPIKERLWSWRIPGFERLLEGADIYFAPSFLEIISNLKIPQVLTIHDLTTFLFPEHLGKGLSRRFNTRMAEATKIAKKIIVISDSTRRDLQEILKIKQGKIAVIYPGRKEFTHQAKKLPQGLKSNQYILAVSTIEPRKNLVTLFKSYALLAPDLQNKYPLAVVGAKGWNFEESLEVIESLKLKDKIKFLGFVPDQLLAKLYQEAKVFVYPSLYEGFGLPVLEALSFGVPAIASDVSSIPEIAGRAAILVEPTDARQIASAIERLLEHENEAKSLKKLALAQAKKFSWDMAAKETLAVFKEVADEE